MAAKLYPHSSHSRARISYTTITRRLWLQRVEIERICALRLTCRKKRPPNEGGLWKVKIASAETEEARHRLISDFTGLLVDVATGPCQTEYRAARLSINGKH